MPQHSYSRCQQHRRAAASVLIAKSPTWSVSAMVAALLFLILRATLAAAPPANPYQAISNRNVFGLRPPMPLVAAEPDKAPPARITLTGITTILGDKRVLFKATRSPKPGQPQSQEQSCILTVGQREADLEVLDINEQTGDVTINNCGTIMTLNIEKDGAKLNRSLSLRDLPPPAAAFPHPPGAYHPALFPGRSAT